MNGYLLWIHEDLPAWHPNNPYDYSILGDLVWEWEVPIDVVDVVRIDAPSTEGWYDPSGEWVPDDHDTYYQYNITDIPDPFRQQEGTIYWLKICTDVVEPETRNWGWKSSQDHWNDDAVWRNGPPDWVELYEPPLLCRVARPGVCNNQHPGRDSDCL